jgi:hypothetical protein
MRHSARYWLLTAFTFALPYSAQAASNYSCDNTFCTCRGESTSTDCKLMQRYACKKGSVVVPILRGKGFYCLNKDSPIVIGRPLPQPPSPYSPPDKLQ